MKKQLLKIISLCIIGTLIFSCSDLDDNEEVGTVDIENLIQKESELFNLIERVAETDDEDEITCIKFLYSFTLVEFGTDLLPVNEYVVSSDENFSFILDNISDGNSIGINFPIQSILESGEEFLIQNKEELKQSIDDCIEAQQEELAGQCRLLLQECVWVVSHNDENEDTYEHAVFDVADDGTFKFYNNGELHEGTWIVYFIEDELHTNVNFNDEGMTGDDWNFDWKTQILSEETMTFTKDDTSFTLTKECEEENYCTQLIFSECEDIDGSEISEFIFQDYIPCILQIEDLEVLTENDSIAFYETQMDADLEVNPLSQESYQNITQEQTIYVRVYYASSDEFFIIPITIRSTTC
ncbi:hypothetical protein U8527_03935 [Kordia algicida OT-1]|uniref:Uncharacterized protein n=1 Tax=Kordia algicida OT-1 TaxID=391587 RepID=A9DPM9_9FLAO|nr:hypothetical protein [Kordia algicida]EDP97474.1 hypothetical protein KAOT1_19967 [Kordia algicida OT-1]